MGTPEQEQDKTTTARTLDDVRRELAQANETKMALVVELDRVRDNQRKNATLIGTLEAEFIKLSKGGS